MARYPVKVEGEDGWTDWENPNPKGYRLACCDCGLIHDFQFRVFKIGRYLGKGSFTKTVPSERRLRVEFRAKRNNRATSARRRWRSK